MGPLNTMESFSTAHGILANMLQISIKSAGNIITMRNDCKKTKKRYKYHTFMSLVLYGLMLFYELFIRALTRKMPCVRY